MVRLSFLLLKNRKRFAAAIIAVITFSAVLSLASYVIAESGYARKKQLALENYGSFICGICELSEQDDEKIRACDEIRSGHVVLYGTVPCAGDRSLTIGWADENFLQMANAGVLDGTMPAGEDEIAVEQFAAELLGIGGAGEETALNINGTQRTVRVTAIVRNYSNQLNVYYRLKKGVNDYPNIFCTDDFEMSDEPGESHYSAILGYWDDSKIRTDQLAALNGMHEAVENIGLSSGNLYDNDNLYVRGMQYCGSVNKFSRIFLILAILSSIACMLLLYRVFYRDYREKISVFMAYGLRKKQVKSIFMVQIFFFILVSFALSLLIYPALICTALRFSDRFALSVSVAGGFRFLCAWFLTVTACTVPVIFKTVISDCEGIYLRLEASSGDDRMTGKGQRYPEGTNIIKKLMSVNVETAVLNILMFFFCLISLYSYHTTYTDYYGTPDYELIAKEITETECVNGYEVEHGADRSIPKTAMDYFAQYEGIFLDTYVNVSSNTLLLRENQSCSYFDQWISMYEPAETNYEDSVILERWPSEADSYVPVPNVEITAVTDEQLLKVCTSYQLSSDDPNGIVLFLPGAADGDVKEILGGSIIIGGINQQDGNVSFEKAELPVNGIVLSAYQMEYGEYSQQRSGITVVMSKTLLAQLNLAKGFRELRIFDRGGDASGRMEINNQVNRIMNGIEGGSLYVKSVIQDADRQYVQFIHLMGVFTVSILIVFVCIYVYTQMFWRLFYQRRLLGILAALGLHKKRLALLLYISDLKSIMISFGADLLFLTVILYLRILEQIDLLVLSASFLMVIGMSVILGIAERIRLRKMPLLGLINREI